MVMRPFKSRMAIPSCSRCWISRLMSDGHLEADERFDVFDGNHFDGIPGAAVEEGTVGPLADTFLTADAEHRVHLDAAEGRMVFIGHPIHAIGHGAIGHAGGCAGTTGAALGD